MKTTKTKRLTRSTLILYGFAILFAFMFNQIYGLFAHGVSSYHMSLIWLWLAALGVPPLLVLMRLPKYAEKERAYLAYHRFFHTGVAIFSIGELLNGILEIAGTDSQYLFIYFYMGIAFMTLGALAFAVLCFRFKCKFFTHHDAHSAGHH